MCPSSAATFSSLRQRLARSVSEPYVDLTLGLLADFGVRIDGSAADGRFTVPAPQAYRAADLTIEADASTASYFFARLDWIILA